MAVYDTFGFALDDLEQVRSALENCLGIRFVPHESSFIGDYYLYENPENGESLSLQRNEDPEEGGPLYCEFSEFPTVLHVSETDRSDELAALLQRAVEGCKLAKHEEIP